MADETRNVNVQWLDRVNSELAGSTNVHWPGGKLQQEDVTEWIEPVNLGHTPRAANGSARIEDWTFQVTCYARAGQGQTETVHRAWELADLVYGAFDRTEVSVVDWDVSGGGTEVGKLMFLQPSVDVVPGPVNRSNAGTQPEEIMQVAVTIPAVFRSI